MFRFREFNSWLLADLRSTFCWSVAALRSFERSSDVIVLLTRMAFSFARVFFWNSSVVCFAQILIMALCLGLVSYRLSLLVLFESFLSENILSLLVLVRSVWCGMCCCGFTGFLVNVLTPSPCIRSITQQFRHCSCHILVLPILLVWVRCSVFCLFSDQLLLFRLFWTFAQIKWCD